MIPLDIPPYPPADSATIWPLLVVALVVVVGLIIALTAYYRRRPRA